MSEEPAQTTATPGGGASNANDFQPTTQNPQAIPTNLFQQQTGVQNVTNPQELLNEQRNVRITVTKEPAATPAMAQANESPMVFYAAFLAVFIVVAILLYKKLRRRPKTNIGKNAAAEAGIADKAEVLPAPKRPAAQPKTTPKKKKAKRKHR